MTVLNTNRTPGRWAAAGLVAASLAFGPGMARAEIGAVIYDACSNAVTSTSPAFDQLGTAGWSLLRSYDAQVQSLLAAGILASMATDRNTPLDWASARPLAEDAAGTLLEVAEIGAAKGYTFGDPITAVLVVSGLPAQGGYKVLHCVAAGDLSAGFSDYAAKLRAADQSAGLTQATPGLELFNIRAQSKTETDPPKTIATDATLGLYDLAAGPFNTPPAASAGLSLYRYTQE